MCKSTDVPGSIAGYYYQILLACRELTSDTPDLEAVGVEAEADVRVIKSGTKKSIEAKFHKKNMARYDGEIIKTIYNFYRNSHDDEALEFSTNVAPTKDHKDFFDNWNNKSLTEEEMNMYILKCLFKHCCFNVNNYKKNYSEYKSSIIKKDGKEEKEPYYMDRLQSEIFNVKIDDSELDKYSLVNSMTLDKEFSKKLSFAFYDTKKLDTIKKLKEDINRNLKKICKRNKRSITENDYDKIRDLMIDKFFMIITYNTELPSDHTFNELKKFSKDDLEDCIKNYNVQKAAWLNNEKINNLIRALENEEKNFIDSVEMTQDSARVQELINRRSEIQQLFLNKIIDVDRYNKFIFIYTLKDFDSFEVILKLINQLTILSVYKNINIDDISFFIDNNKSLDNVFIKDLLNYSFKACPPSYRNFRAIIQVFYDSTNQKYSIDPNQIVIFQADFGSNENPCKKKEDSLNCVLDIAATDENLEKEIALYKSINYRCSACIYLTDKDEDTLDNIHSFLCCRGCKK
ncbi:hypothetical protein I6U48_00870 [Clostridium sp. PL3]|uniref:Uncharacterized protein n=1 Tax=Clostridium thailandense TaxID=2794346 RepID=A0A949TJ38_9CLOT|nr:hypothetical protein [Clostridium thailandense]MBV7271472.1 hypothetical protein [Clostridium thailandense]